jgi:hypothetical protein
VGDVVSFIVLEWLADEPAYPRYSFATSKHAEELGENVQQLDVCPSLVLAAARVTTLNLADAAKRKGARL